MFNQDSRASHAVHNADHGGCHGRSAKRAYSSANRGRCPGPGIYAIWSGVRGLSRRGRTLLAAGIISCAGVCEHLQELTFGWKNGLPFLILGPCLAIKETKIDTGATHSALDAHGHRSLWTRGSKPKCVHRAPRSRANGSGHHHHLSFARSFDPRARSHLVENGEAELR